MLPEEIIGVVGKVRRKQLPGFMTMRLSLRQDAWLDRKSEAMEREAVRLGG